MKQRKGTSGREIISTVALISSAKGLCRTPPWQLRFLALGASETFEETAAGQLFALQHCWLSELSTIVDKM
jgi:hypothetical protein